jgi:peptidoglycan LD-endopeptidase LytH
MQAFVLPAMVTSCEQRERLGATPRETETREAIADHAAIVVDSMGKAPLAPRPASAPAEPAGSVATPGELAELMATLEMPVQGITRSELRDTYAEPRGDHLHEALDIHAARGTPVLSASDGRLLKLFNSKAGGLMVYATDVSERFILLYGHLDRYAEGLGNGMRLERGQIIGYVGTTGNAPPGTPHLHFGILRGQPKHSWSRGVPVNPYPLLVPARPRQ